tara:strand:- start:2699 stop:3586 length:888 start_codon:yes stop_codon:yes gene_type:complete
MNVLIGGSNGLIGKELVNRLRLEGHRVICLVRREPFSSDEIQWDIPNRKINLKDVSSIDGVIHLGGAPIADRRWSDSVCEELRSSRILSTELLVEILKEANVNPKVFICASAIGIYGDRLDEKLTERSSVGRGFLADLTSDWEKMASKASIERVISARFGIVLSPRGGALGKMLLPFRLGVGGKLGAGHHYMSWITLSDAVSALMFMLENSNSKGPINIVSPSPVRNEEFTRILGKVLGRPALFPVPSFALRLLFGSMVDEVLLSSQRVIPDVLLREGFKFDDSNLETALSEMLN